MASNVCAWLVASFGVAVKPNAGFNLRSQPHALYASLETDALELKLEASRRPDVSMAWLSLRMLDKHLAKEASAEYARLSRDETVREEVEGRRRRLLWLAPLLYATPLYAVCCLPVFLVLLVAYLVVMKVRRRGPIRAFGWCDPLALVLSPYVWACLEGVGQSKSLANVVEFALVGWTWCLCLAVRYALSAMGCRRFERFYGAATLFLVFSAAALLATRTWTNATVSVTETCAYDMLGNRVATTDALGNATCRSFDPFGNVAAEWGAAHPVRRTYDTQGRRTSLSTTRDGTVWDTTIWTYDPRTGGCVSKAYADGSSVTYTYTPDNLPLRTTYASGRWTENVYDSRRQVVGTVSCDGSAYAAFAHDAGGCLVAASNAAVSYAYTPDGLDAGYTITLAGGATFTRAVTRDPFRRELAARVESGVNGVSVERLDCAHDALGRPVSRNADSFAYNARGEVVFSRRGAENEEEAYTYDFIGNLLSRSGPLADAFRFRFSTKYLDAETGLYYYGYRFYSPGRSRRHRT